MKDKIISGYAYSYITEIGHERLIMSSFGITKTKSKRYFNHQNGLIGTKTMTAHKRYKVEVKVIEEAPIIRGDE
jgi:hypothetical protein